MAKYEIPVLVKVIMSVDSDKKSVTGIAVDLGDSVQPIGGRDHPLAWADGGQTVGDADEAKSVFQIANDADWPEVSEWTQLQDFVEVGR